MNIFKKEEPKTNIVFDTIDESVMASKLLDYFQIFNEMVGDEETITVMQKDLDQALILLEEIDYHISDEEEM